MEAFGEIEKEEHLYEPIRKALSRKISDSYFEITKKGFSDKLQKEFDDETLYLINIEGIYPDITGFIKRDGYKDVITVEVKKGKIQLKHVFQAKKYGELYKSPYCFLVSIKRMPEKTRRFLLKRTDILRYFGGHYQVIIARFVHTGFEFDNELYPTLPEPLKLLRVTRTSARDFLKKKA